MVEVIDIVKGVYKSFPVRELEIAHGQVRNSDRPVSWRDAHRTSSVGRLSGLNTIYV